MMPIIFITGIGTGVGKTIVSSIVCEALAADYCKPIQAGLEGMTDTKLVQSLISNKRSKIHPELFRLKLPASPHIAAKEEGIKLEVSIITDYLQKLLRPADAPLVVEGAGGLLVPVNEKENMLDLIISLNASVIIVSRNYLGSINHSLLTARVLKDAGVNTAGWIFNDQFMNYENEIVNWTKLKSLGSVPFIPDASRNIIYQQAAMFKNTLEQFFLS